MLTSAKQSVTSPNCKMQMCILIERPTYEVSTYPPSPTHHQLFYYHHNRLVTFTFDLVFCV